MGRVNWEGYTREQLLRALAAAGCAGMARAKKADLLAAASKLRGAARERALDALARSEKPEPKPRGKMPARTRAAATPRRGRAVEAEPRLRPVKRVARPAAAPARTPKPKPASIPVPPPQQEEPHRGPPLPEEFTLPEAYGIDMFHVLVFDPDSAYIFWELSPERLALLREEVGGQRWLARKLAVRACVPGGRTLVQELYGDRGSYFLRVNAPGETVAFELGFAVAGGFHCTGLGRAVSFPRISESPDASVRVLRVALTEEPLTVQEEAPEAAYGRPPVPLSERHRKWPPAKPAYGTPSSAERLKRHD